MVRVCGDGLGKGLVMCSRERRYICGELGNAALQCLYVSCGFTRVGGSALEVLRRCKQILRHMTNTQKSKASSEGEHKTWSKTEHPNRI